MRNNSSVNRIEDAGNYALVQAARSGNLTTVNNLLAQDVNPNSIRPISDDTALNVAAYYGHEEIVKTLLRAGANVDGQHSAGRTPLMSAAHQGRLNIVNILLAAGADIFARDEAGHMVMDYLTRAEEIGAGPNPRLTGSSRLKIVELISSRIESYHQHLLMFLRLVEAHLAEDLADVRANEIRIEERRRVAQLANEVLQSGNIIQGLADFLRLALEMNDQFLIEHIFPPIRGFSEERVSGYRVTESQKIIARALTGAAVKGQTQVIEALSTLPGFYIDAMDKKNRTALMCAVEEGHIETIRALLRLGANINAKGRFGWAVLHYAVKGEVGSELIKELIDRGADINARTDLCVFSRSLREEPRNQYPDIFTVRKFSVLEYAIYSNNLFAVRDLIECKVELNEVEDRFDVTLTNGRITGQTKMDDSPLDIALRRYEERGEFLGKGKRAEIITLLLECGAHTNLADLPGRVYDRFMVAKTLAVSNLDQIMIAALWGDEEYLKTFNEPIGVNGRISLSSARNVNETLSLIGYNAALALQILFPEDIIPLIRAKYTICYKFDERGAEREIQKLRTLQANLVLKFTEKGDPDPQLTAKIATAAFASYSTQSLFNNIVVLVSAMQSKQLPPSAIVETIHNIAVNKIPGFTPYHTYAVVEVMMERAHQITNGKVKPFLVPESTPTLPTAQNLVSMQQEEQGEEKGLYS